jgi:hypothetical protein
MTWLARPRPATIITIIHDCLGFSGCQLFDKPVGQKRIDHEPEPLGAPYGTVRDQSLVLG